MRNEEIFSFHPLLKAYFPSVTNSPVIIIARRGHLLIQKNEEDNSLAIIYRFINTAMNNSTKKKDILT